MEKIGHFNKKRSASTTYPVPLFSQDSRKPTLPEGPENPNAMLSSTAKLTPPQRKAAKVMADIYNTTETEESREMQVRGQALGMLAEMDVKGLTIREIEISFERPLSAFEGLQTVLQHIEPSEYQSGLHVQKLKKRVMDMEKRTAKNMEDLKKIGIKVEKHYPEELPYWQEVMQDQQQVIAGIQKIKEDVESFLESSPVTFDHPAL